MLTAFKTLMGIMCYCILSPPLLASAISQHSVCFCPSPSLSERISHPLLLQLLAASLLNSTIRSSPALSFILHFHSSPHSSSHSFSFIFFRVCLFLTRVELPTVGLILLLPTTSSFHPTLLLLIGTEGG